MKTFGLLLTFFLAVSLVASAFQNLHAQDSMGFLERYALAKDRQSALQELVPGSDDYFYYRSLYEQNTQQVAKSAATLEAWRTNLTARKINAAKNRRFADMMLRQMLLQYDQNPKATTDYLRRELNATLSHSAPSRSRKPQYPTEVPGNAIDRQRLIEKTLAQTGSSSALESSVMPKLLQSSLSDNQVREVVAQLNRADVPGVVELVARELRQKGSKGFGWARVHRLMVRDQLLALAQRLPQLNGSDRFVSSVLATHLPPYGSTLADVETRDAYLNEILPWVVKLPASQNNLKAHVLGNRLKTDLRLGKPNRATFLEYLKLPRRSSFWLKRNRRISSVDFAFQPKSIPLPPVADDTGLIRANLEAFLRSSNRLDDFADFIERSFLERVLAETNILFGKGETSNWYRQLPPNAQQELRDRIELEFSPENQTTFATKQSVGIKLRIKNVENLLVKIFPVNLPEYFRQTNRNVATSIDVDGLVPAIEKRLQYDLPSDRRHLEELQLPELTGRGVWVIDVLGGGKRCRALVRKGALTALSKNSPAGQVVQVFREDGTLVKNSTIEFNGQRFGSDKSGIIVLPFAEQSVSRDAILLDGAFACLQRINHQAETLKLNTTFVIDPQACVSGQQASVLLHSQLLCNSDQSSITHLQAPKLTIKAFRNSKLVSQQVISDLELDDGIDALATFMVPPQITQLSFELSGQVTRVTDGIDQTISASQVFELNGIQRTSQIGDFFLQPSTTGYDLLLLGRNGEPFANRQIEFEAKVRGVKQPVKLTLATDAKGTTQLGKLTAVETIKAVSAGVAARTFILPKPTRAWPSHVHLAKEKIRSFALPLGANETYEDAFSLIEMRGSARAVNHNQALVIKNGLLKFDSLAEGKYLLIDYAQGSQTQIIIGTGVADNCLSNDRIFSEASLASELAIEKAWIQNDQLKIKVIGQDEYCRLHLVALPLLGKVDPTSFSLAPGTRHRVSPLSPLESFFTSGLKLDEEYDYILRRRLAPKFTGNLLPHPSLLLHPWEISETNNATQRAGAGEAMPMAANDAVVDFEEAKSERMLREVKAQIGATFEFLGNNAQIVANIEIPDSGELSIPLEKLAGFSLVNAFLVHPKRVDSRAVALPEPKLNTRPNQLKQQLSSNSKLTQTQTVEIIRPGKSIEFSEGESPQLETISSIREVFSLYKKLLNDKQFSEFEFLCNWPSLSQEDKLAKYRDYACHELNLFVFFKDRQFFDQVVATLLENKAEKQLIDLWLLGSDLSEFTPLWQRIQLNSLERILLAQTLATQTPGTLDEELASLRKQLEARPDESQEIEDLFGAVLTLGKMSVAGRPGAGGGGGRRFEEQESKLALGMQLSQSLQRKSRGRVAPDFFGMPSTARELFRSLKSTREWVESNYYRLRKANQNPELIAPSRFWLDFGSQGCQPFLSDSLHLACSNRNEALCALAVLDLPFQGASPTLESNGKSLVLRAEKSACICFSQKIISCSSDLDNEILLGTDVFRANARQSTDSQPVAYEAMVTGVPYKQITVLTNPNNRAISAGLLTQIPKGSIPLANTSPISFSTQQIKPYQSQVFESTFYFPNPGKYSETGPQASKQLQSLGRLEPLQFTVQATPSSVDADSWEEIARWGSNTKVLEFLKKNNPYQLDLDILAFRMKDEGFFESCTRLLADHTLFRKTLWNYSLLHNSKQQLRQLIQNNASIRQRVVHLKSPLYESPSFEPSGYEHIEYRPLVLARRHQLGAERKILNSALARQYREFLNHLAYQSELSDPDKLQLCYYLIIQNRIAETIGWFRQISPENLSERIQFDYMRGYLAIHQGEYAKAAEIAAKAPHSDARWKDLFEQLGNQVSERQAMIAGASTNGANAQPSGEAQQILADSRDSDMKTAADKHPQLNVSQTDGQIIASTKNIKELEIRYYLMDIELLFSRTPFLGNASAKPPVVLANMTTTRALASDTTTVRIDPPKELDNRNAVLEVVGGGVSRTLLITANQLDVQTIEAYGQIRVRNRGNRHPVDGAYVKVYAKHSDGSVRFFKDGYTDLRGFFDFASVSNDDLNTTTQFSILVMDEELGALVQPANVPAR